MNIVSHIASPIVFAQSANVYRSHNRKPSFFNWKHLLLIGLFGGLPDMLSPHFDFGSRYNSFTHSIWFLLIALFVAFILAWQLPMIKKLILFCCFAVIFHLVCDMISGGINIFAPFGEMLIGRNYVLTRYWIPLDITAILFLSVPFLYNRWPIRTRSFALVLGLAVAMCGAGLAFSNLDTETFFFKRIPVSKIDRPQLEKAVQVLDTLFKKWETGTFEPLSNEFSADRREVLTAKWQESFFNRVRSDLGSFQGICFAEAITARFYFPRIHIYRFKESFSQIPHQSEIDIGLNSNGKVSHFIWRDKFSSRLMDY